MGDTSVKLGLAEILSMAAKEKKLESKQAVLSMNDSPHLRMIIKYIMDPTVIWWDFLKGSPAPYKPNKYMDAEGRLYSDLRLLYMFVETGDEQWGRPPGLPLQSDQIITRIALQQNQQKRQRIWIQLLESITPEDAELLCAAPNKDFPFKGLSRKLIDDTFPGLLSPEGEKAATVAPAMEEKIAPSHGMAPVRPATEVVEISLEDILGEDERGKSDGKE